MQKIEYRKSTLQSYFRVVINKRNPISMRFTSYLSVLLLFVLGACNWILKPDIIGWIEYDPELDDAGFELCDEEASRRGKLTYPRYKEGRRDLKAFLIENTQNLIEKEGENGHIIIRFLVNCKSKVGRFRTEQLGRDYKSKAFDETIIASLISSLHSIQEWQLPENTDGYIFITCKIENGKLVDVI